MRNVNGSNGDWDRAPGCGARDRAELGLHAHGRTPERGGRRRVLAEPL